MENLVEIKISPFSNLLFFIQKKSERKLIKFDFKNYINDGHIDTMFYGKNESEIWAQINKSINKNKQKDFKENISVIEPSFKPYWKKEFTNLSSWKKYFQKNQAILQQTILDIKKTIKVKIFKTLNVPIYIVSDPIEKSKEINAWFSWTPKESFIVIEVPHGLKAPNNLFPVSILAHEYFHLILRKQKNIVFEINKIVQKNKKLLTKMAEGMPSRMFFEELLISSFLPEGYLSEKNFNMKVSVFSKKPKSLLDWRKFIAHKLKEETKKRIGNNQGIDKKYLDYLMSFIK